MDFPSTTLIPTEQPTDLKNNNKSISWGWIIIMVIIVACVLFVLYDCFTTTPTPFYCFYWLFF